MKNKPFSLKLIYWLTNIVYYFMILGAIMALIFSLLLFFNKIGDMHLNVSLPIKVDFHETGILHLNNQNIKVELVGAAPKIHFLDTPNFLTKQLSLFIILIVSFCAFLVYTFRTFVKNVYQGSVFSLKNIALLKQLAYGLIGMWMFGVIYFRLGYHFLAKNLIFENIHITDDIPNYSGVLLTALFIWVLAHIFKMGLELKQETDLTI